MADVRSEHWDHAYEQGDTTRSWFQEQPQQSLHMLDSAGVSATDSVIDIGGGASRLVDALLHKGFADVTVLDVSSVALQTAQERLGPAAARVTWVCADLLAWRPERTYRGWHDRAVFHFLTDVSERDRYLRTLDAATEPGSTAVFGCFAIDGPAHCSGLPVARYDAAGLAALVSADWRLVAHEREEHRTPGGAIQPFTWVALRRER